MTYKSWARDKKKGIQDNSRILKILEKIGKHGKIHHNALKKEMSKEGIVTRIFDRLMKELEGNKLVTTTRMKNRKYYSLQFDFDKRKKTLFKDIKAEVVFVRMDVSFLINNYEQSDLLNKSARTFFVIKHIFRALEKIAFFNALYGINNETKQREEKLHVYLKEIFKTIKKDKDVKMILTLIQNNQFPSRYSYSMNELPITS